MSIVRVPFSLTGGGAAGYVPAGAILLDGTADYLSWTPSSAGNRRTMTFSWWQKLSNVSSGWHQVFGVPATTSYIGFYHTVGYVSITDTSGALLFFVSNPYFRDPTAWQHWCVSIDTTTQTVTVEVNGVPLTSWSSSTVALNHETGYGNNTQQIIGAQTTGFGFFDGYLSEVIFIDGTVYSATDFGEYDTNNNWIPKDPTGLTFGTNGFWLDFADSADLGNDVSGNGNDFTPTSMSAANSTSDRPADDAENGFGNYCTLNQLDASLASNVVLTNGNTILTAPGGNGGTGSTFAVTSGKWYWEVKLDNTGYNDGSVSVGFKQILQVANNAFWGDRTLEEGWYATGGSGKLRNNGTTTAYGPDATSEGVVMIALDLDNAKAWWGLNGTWFTNGGVGDPAAGTNAAPTTIAIDGSVPITPGGSAQPSDELTFRFEESEWSYSAPTGFKALSTANLPAPTVTDPSAYFQSVLYTGNGTVIGSGGNAITGVGFQPDFVWIKNRDAADSHMIFDAVRGVTKSMSSDTGATETTDTESLSTFDTDGFTVGNNVAVNTNTENYVAWCLKAGGAGSSNTDGSITSTVSAAAHGGFSIGTYNGTGSAATVGHGLSRAPDWVIVKMTAGTGTQNWTVFQKNIFDGASNAYIILNLPDASTSGASFSSTAPTASVFSVGNDATNQSSSTFVFYAFAKTPGFIASGKYTGNGSTDGPYVVVDDGGSGFRPAFVLIKNSSNATGYDWQIVDATRDTYNPVNKNLSPNLATTEGSGLNIDFTANGFKPRVSSNSVNASGNTYIYLAFAEYPFGGDGVAQAKAR